MSLPVLTVSLPYWSPRLSAALSAMLGERWQQWIMDTAAISLERIRRHQAGITHGALGEEAAKALGYADDDAADLRVVFDLIQLAIDITDDLADAEEDAAEGRRTTVVGSPIPRASLHAMAPLLVGCATAHLSAAFQGEGWRSSYANSRILQVLGTMAAGQAEEDPDDRLPLISGTQGLLLALPVWLRSDQGGLSTDERDAFERWLVAWANTWQRLQFTLDDPTDRQARFALGEARLVAYDLWPEEGALFQGGPFDRRRAYFGGAG